MYIRISQLPVWLNNIKRSLIYIEHSMLVGNISIYFMNNALHETKQILNIPGNI